MRVQNRHQKPLHSLSHQHKEVDMHRGKRTSEAGSPSLKFSRQRCKDYLKGTCTKSPCDYWHPPEFNSMNLNRDANLVISARLHTDKLVEGQPRKNPKKDGDKSAVAVLKDARQLGCVFRSGHRAAGIFTVLTKEHKSRETNSTSAILKFHTASRKHSRKQRSIAWCDAIQKNPHQRSSVRFKF